MHILFLTIRRHWVFSLIAFFIFLPLILLFNGILNKYLFVPDWYPKKPTVFSPKPPLFTEHTFVWKLSDQWLIQVTISDIFWLLIISVLFFLNVALIVEGYRSKIKFFKMNLLAYPLAFLAFVGCCFSALFILLFGVGVLVALAPYVMYFKVLSVALFSLNIWFMIRALKRTQV